MNARMNFSNRTWTHPEAKQWLTEFMIDLKKMVLIDENYQPFTMERLNEWSKHHADISSCLDFEAPLSSWTGEPPLEHQQALICFFELVSDLKVAISGHPDLLDGIEDRIAEADKYYSEICQCQKRQLIYY